MRHWIIVILALWLTIFVPAWLRQEPPQETAAPPADTPAVAVLQAPPITQPTACRDSDIRLRLWDGSAVTELTAEEYLPGVVRGEMPAAFEPEALKAQAVAERTYLCYRLQAPRKSAHPDADVCTDPGCCSAYLSQTQAQEKWGAAFEEHNGRILDACTATEGKVVLYEGAPIMAVFHSSSAAMTATSGEVWTADLPYLKSVVSPESAEDVPNYYSVVELSPEQFRQTFSAHHGDAVWPEEVSAWVQAVTLSDTGRVETAQIGGVTVTGAEIRSIFALRSTSFTVEPQSDGIVFRVTGYGHGVGLSQYGANALAREGKSWQEILQWYYTDVTIGDYTAP